MNKNFSIYIFCFKNLIVLSRNYFLLEKNSYFIHYATVGATEPE
jgi:hypothetical protein